MSNLSLNQQIAEALHGELHYAQEDGDIFFWRVGKDDLNDIAYDIVEDYEHSLDAVLAELNDSKAELCIDFADGRATLRDPSLGFHSESYFDDKPHGAAARLLHEWALAQQKDGA
jgi:hypothetical protein